LIYLWCDKFISMIIVANAQLVVYTHKLTNDLSNILKKWS